MDDARRGQIALAFLKHRMREEGIKLGPDFKSEVERVATCIQVPLEEAQEFAEELTRGYVDEVFAKTKPAPQAGSNARD